MFAAVALLSVFAADATAPAAPASIANLATNPANTDAHLKSVAGALTDLLKTNGANQASNTSDIVKTIKDLLEKNMKGHVIGNFNKSLAAIESSRNEFVKCRLTYAKSDPVRFPATSLLQANGTNSTPWYEAYFQAYSQCKAGSVCIRMQYNYIYNYIYIYIYVEGTFMYRMTGFWISLLRTSITIP